MRRCLQLAALGRGHVSPNPMVGAVVVHKMKSCLENLQSMFRSNLVLIMGKHLRAAN